MWWNETDVEIEVEVEVEVEDKCCTKEVSRDGKDEDALKIGMCPGFDRNVSRV